jgi:hypothetical protein
VCGIRQTESRKYACLRVSETFFNQNLKYNEGVNFFQTKPVKFKLHKIRTYVMILTQNKI